ncbi:MAG: WXG100 family type VII secretion target [Lachnospiraceae bacterium]|nr:WXG100 family type VII secretion target [Lachnospiraceae bacterium]
MAMTGSLLVTPEKLMETSSEFSNCMSQVQSLTTSMMDLIHGMNSFWEGEAASAYNNKFNELQDDIQKIHTMINEHVTDLNEMATIYKNAESKSQEISQALSGNVL